MWSLFFMRFKKKKRERLLNGISSLDEAGDSEGKCQQWGGLLLKLKSLGG